LAALGADENSPEIQAVQAELEAGLAEVDAELDQDMAYVDQELKELDAMRLEITRAEEALKIEQLRNDLTAGS
jgi:Skp family chaperone for outer membrane proteins